MGVATVLQKLKTTTDRASDIASLNYALEKDFRDQSSIAIKSAKNQLINEKFGENIIKNEVSKDTDRSMFGPNASEEVLRTLNSQKKRNDDSDEGR